MPMHRLYGVALDPIPYPRMYMFHIVHIVAYTVPYIVAYVVPYAVAYAVPYTVV